MVERTQITDLEKFLPFKIAQLHSLLNAQARAVISRYGPLTLPQWRVIRVVGADAASNSTAVRKVLHLDKSQFSKTLAALSDGGYVTLSPYEKDQRQSLIELTAKGRRALRELEPALNARNAHLLAALPPDQQKSIFASLQALSEAAMKTDFELMEQA